MQSCAGDEALHFQTCDGMITKRRHRFTPASLAVMPWVSWTSQGEKTVPERLETSDCLKLKRPFLFPLNRWAAIMKHREDSEVSEPTAMHWEQAEVVLGHLRRRVRMSVHNSWWKPEQRGLMCSERGKLLFPDIFRLCVRNVLWSKASDDLKNTLNLQHEGRGLHQAGGSCRGCQSLPEDDTDQEFRGVWGSAGSWRLTFRLLYCF